MRHFKKHLATLPRRTVNIQYTFYDLPEPVKLGDSIGDYLGFIIGDLCFVDKGATVEIWTQEEKE